MSRITVVIIPEGTESSKQYSISRLLLKFASFLSFVAIGLVGFLLFDYMQLRELRSSYLKLSSENDGLKGEARLLMNNLEEVKLSLKRVQDYSEKLGEITNVKVRKVSKLTGIGPLSPEEFQAAKNAQNFPAGEPEVKNTYFPLGINMEKLIFKPAFEQIDMLGKEAGRSAIELQQLLSSLTQKRSLLSSIPSVAPVNGWITSGFGVRISPFTGIKTMHAGIDVAAPVGSPVFASADGVVIFSGKKQGYGNFIMLAHGYGVVTAYGHNAENMVQIGQKVVRGEQLATVGMTGRTTGPHVHYEVILNGKNTNPTKFILDMSDE